MRKNKEQAQPFRGRPGPEDSTQHAETSHLMAAPVELCGLRAGLLWDVQLFVSLYGPDCGLSSTYLSTFCHPEFLGHLEVV